MALKLKFRSKFPANVAALSPLTLTKTGMRYVFGLNIDELGTLGVRTKLTEDQSFYVRPNGIGSTGSANDDLHAFGSGTTAYNYIRDNLDLNGFEPQILVQNGLYIAPIVINGPCVGGTVAVVGNVSDPSLTVISPVGASAVKVTNAVVKITSLGFISDTGHAHLFIGSGSIVSYGSNRHADALGGGDHILITDGGIGIPIADYVFGGSFGSHIHFRRGAELLVPDGATVTATAVGTPIAVNYFVGGNAALADMLGMVWAGSAVTGPKFLLHNGARLNTGTAGNLSWLPGSTPGTFPDAWAWYDNMFCGAAGLSAGAPFAADALITANGNTAASPALVFGTQVHTVGANDAIGGVTMDAFGGAGGQAWLLGRLAFGTAAAPFAVNSAQLPLLIVAQSRDSTGAYGTNGTLEFAAAASQTGTDHNGYIRIRVVPSGSTTLAEAMRFGGGAGGVQIGTPTGGDKGLGSLNVQGDIYNNSTAPTGTAGYVRAVAPVIGLVNATGLPLSTGITGAGTGVLTALAINVGSAGAFVTFNGAGGTPSSLALTNATGLPTTGLTGTLQAAQEPAHTGDVTNSAGSLALTLATVNPNVGTFGSATQSVQFTANAKGLLTAAANVTITPAIGSITGLGTGVATALAVNVGSAGAPVLFNGALGTPLSGVGTNLTGTASGLTAGNVTTNANLTGHVTSVGNAAVLGSFTTAQLNTALSDGDIATLAGAESLTNKNLAGAGNTFPTFNQNTTGSAATLTTSRNIDGQAFNGSADITVIAPGTNAATSKATPVDADQLPLVDSAASNVLKKLTWANLKATLKTYFDTLYATLDTAAWTPYSPSVVSATVGGTPATYTVNSARYKVGPGKTCHVKADVSVTNQGIGAGGSINIDLPFTSGSLGATGGGSFEYALTARAGRAYIGNSVTQMKCSDATNTTYIVTGNSILASATYETV